MTTPSTPLMQYDSNLVQMLLVKGQFKIAKITMICLLVFSYAPLQKLQWNLVSKISQKTIWAVVLKLNVLIGDKMMTQLTFEKKK